MIELLIIVGLAWVGWLVWKGKLKPFSKTPGTKHASPPQQARTSAANTNPQTNSSPTAPVAQQPVEPAAAPTVQAPEPVVEVTPSVSVVASVAAEPASPLAAEATAAKLPEDSILKRHYLAALQAEKDALSNPHPTDSVLRRHYETLHNIAIPQHSKTVDESEPNQPQVAARQASVAEADLPENSLVQTHDLDQLRSEIAAELPAPPTDSVLKRHHDSLLQAKLQQRLSEQ